MISNSPLTKLMINPTGTVPAMFDRCLEFVIDRFYQRTLSLQNFYPNLKNFIFSQICNQVNAIIPQIIGQFPGDIPPVAKAFTLD